MFTSSDDSSSDGENVPTDSFKMAMKQQKLSGVLSLDHMKKPSAKDISKKLEFARAKNLMKIKLHDEKEKQKRLTERLYKKQQEKEEIAAKNSERSN